MHRRTDAHTHTDADDHYTFRVAMPKAKCNNYLYWMAHKNVIMHVYVCLDHVPFCCVVDVMFALGVMACMA